MQSITTSQALAQKLVRPLLFSSPCEDSVRTALIHWLCSQAENDATIQRRFSFLVELWTGDFPFARTCTGSSVGVLLDSYDYFLRISTSVGGVITISYNHPAGVKTHCQFCVCNYESVDELLTSVKALLRRDGVI